MEGALVWAVDIAVISCPGPLGGLVLLLTEDTTCPRGSTGFTSATFKEWHTLKDF